jgi:hypothetical protein
MTLTKPTVKVLSQLHCEQGHEVEGHWTSNSRGDFFQIKCPKCNVKTIPRRLPMGYSDAIKSWSKKYETK